MNYEEYEILNAFVDFINEEIDELSEELRQKIELLIAENAKLKEQLETLQNTDDKPQSKPRRTYKRAYSPMMRLKICTEYVTGEAKRKGLTQAQLAKQYHISRRTLQYWLDDYKNDYEGFIDFYRFVMGELAANGFRKAAEYLRDYAIEIMTDMVGTKPPQSIEINFDDVFANLPDASSGDSIADDLAVFNRFRK